MKTYRVSKKLYNSLIRYDVRTLNTEGELFIVPEKNKWNNKSVMLKRLFIDEGTYFGNKLYTINSLIDRRDTIGMEELILPDKLAIYNDKIIGFTMELVNGINLEEILKSSNYTLKFKKELLIQIGSLLDKLKKLRTYSTLNDFFIGDLHEGNIVYNLDTRRINFVDMDSCKIDGNKPFPSKYLSICPTIKRYPFKYRINEDDNRFSDYICDENTDYFCYVMIILNYLLGISATKLDVSEYYGYLEYLSTLGYHKELIDKFSNIYQSKSNENLFEYLKLLPTDYKTKTLSRYDIFKSKYK